MFLLYLCLSTASARGPNACIHVVSSSDALLREDGPGTEQATLQPNIITTVDGLWKKVKTVCCCVQGRKNNNSTKKPKGRVIPIVTADFMQQCYIEVKRLCGNSYMLIQEAEMILADTYKLSKEEAFQILENIRLVQRNIQGFFTFLEAIQRPSPSPLATHFGIKNALITTYKALTTTFYKLHNIYPDLLPTFGEPKENFGQEPPLLD